MRLKSFLSAAPLSRGLDHHPSFDKTQLQGWKSLQKERDLPTAAWEAHVRHGLEHGLTAADSVEDRWISTFVRGELPTSRASTPS